MSSIGLLRTGGLEVALPLAALREVVPHPGVLDPLPVSTPGLLGSMQLRSAVLPVVDLGALVSGERDATTAASVVVVVTHEGRAIGVVVDEVRGVANVDPDDLQHVTAAGARLLVSHVVQHDGTSTSVLDPAALTSLPGVPTVSERAPAATAAGSTRGRRGTHEPALTVFRCGDHQLALAIHDLRTTVPLTRVTPSSLTGGHCLGTTVHDGREVPVLDPMSLLGLDPVPRDSVTAGVVVPVVHRGGTGAVVLAVTRLERLEHEPGAVMPVPASATRRADLVRGVHRVGDDSCLVLSGDGLHADREVQAYAALGVDVADRTATPTGPMSLTGPTCLSYAVGGTVVATPLAQVLEILPAPTTLVPTRADGVAGLHVHRDQTVTVIDLAAAVGRTSHAPAGCLLLLEVDGRHVGFTVDALHGIEPRTWTDPDARPRTAGSPLTRALETAPLVRLAGATRLVPELDLHHVARSLLDTPTIGACA